MTEKEFDIVKFGKECRKKMIDLDMSMNELAREVSKVNGTAPDPKYLSKVMKGKMHSMPYVVAISQILGISLFEF